MIVYIHGHGASGDSFNYIKTQLGISHICLEYCSDNGFMNNLKDMVDVLKETKGSLTLIGHSLGGLYAINLAAALPKRITRIITMATPFGGSEAAIMLNVFCPQQLYKDITPYSTVMCNSKKIKLSCPLTAIITTKGHCQLMASANDGVVTRDSMMCREDANYVEVHSTHHEVVMHSDTISTIKNVLFL